MKNQKRSKFSGFKYLIVLLFILRGGKSSFSNVSIAIIVIIGIIILINTIKKHQREPVSKYEMTDESYHTEDKDLKNGDGLSLRHSYENQGIEDKMWELKGLRNDELISESKFQREMKKLQRKMNK